MMMKDTRSRRRLIRVVVVDFLVSVSLPPPAPFSLVAEDAVDIGGDERTDSECGPRFGLVLVFGCGGRGSGRGSIIYIIIISIINVIIMINNNRINYTIYKSLLSSPSPS